MKMRDEWKSWNTLFDHHCGPLDEATSLVVWLDGFRSISWPCVVNVMWETNNLCQSEFSSPRVWPIFSKRGEQAETGVETALVFLLRSLTLVLIKIGPDVETWNRHYKSSTWMTMKMMSLQEYTCTVRLPRGFLALHYHLFTIDQCKNSLCMLMPYE